MLYRGHLLTALDARREDFASFERTLREEVGGAAERLAALGGLGARAVRRRTAAGAAASRVSFPSEELDERRSVVVPFGEGWRSHEGARRWAIEALARRTTFAVDGSQIFPGREASLPVAAVQVASFENPHAPEGKYTKDAHFELLTPAELLEGDRAAESPEQVVGRRRFELEAQTLCGFLERMKGWQARGERAPVAFLDGTLLISSRRKGAGEVAFFRHYAEALARLVELSRETEVPVVGYIDQSYAPDLLDLLGALDPGGPRATNVFDAQLLRAPVAAADSTGGGGPRPLLARWGDRTIFWHCQRASLAERFYTEAGEPLVGFVYLQATGDGLPARLEIPAWVYEAGLLEEVLDAVRAECVVGNGYPYAIETADAAAVMTARDREQFLRAVQEFAERHRLDFRVSRKRGSKARRR